MNHDFDCTRAREAIHERLDGEPMDAALLQSLEAHLPACAECRAFQREMQTIQQGLRDLPEMQLPDEVFHRVLAETREVRQSRRPFWAVAAAAAIVVAIGGFWSIRQVDPGPSDAELAQAAAEARLVLKVASDALRKTERAAFHDVMAGELGGALRRAPVNWPAKSGEGQ